MKNRFLILILILGFSSYTQAAVYGEDGRSLIHLSNNNDLKILSQSIAGKLRQKPTPIGGNKFMIITKTLSAHVTNLCPGEKFEDAETATNCTAFLVGKDLMVTAGHCINTQAECESSTWLFSTEVSPYFKNPIVDKSDFVKCEKLVNRVKNSVSKNDWAIFKISKSTKNRLPLKFRTEGKISNDSKLSVIGHPTGLPLIISSDAQILDNNNVPLFKIDSDTFGGNSGSPVFNEETGLVEGILTDGDTDYRLNKARGCKETYQCPTGGCKGENVVRITNIPELVKGMTPQDPIFDPKRPQL